MSESVGGSDTLSDSPTLLPLYTLCLLFRRRERPQKSSCSGVGLPPTLLTSKGGALAKIYGRGENSALA